MAAKGISVDANLFEKLIFLKTEFFEYASGTLSWQSRTQHGGRIAVYLCLVHISTLIACLELNIALYNLYSQQKRVNHIFRTVLL